MRGTRRLLTGGLLLAMITVTGCAVPRPGGDGTIRYRDQVFSSYTKTSDLQYGSAVPQGATTPIPLKLDLYQPSGDTVTKRPAVVWIHGGGFCCGDKSGGPSADLAQKFAKLGYVTVSINYRLISNGCTGGNITSACYQAAIDAQHDAQAAVRFLRANAAQYGVDPTRIGIGGDSAGAIAATAAAARQDDPGDSGNPGYSSEVRGFASLSGGLPNAVFVGAGDAPGVLFSGTADGTVPYSWSVDTEHALQAAHIPAFLNTFNGVGHDPYDAFHAEFILEQSDYFFYDLLDLAHAPGSPPSAARAASVQQRRLARRYPGFARTVKAQAQRARAAR
jgi:predicted esterase